MLRELEGFELFPNSPRSSKIFKTFQELKPRNVLMLKPLVFFGWPSLYATQATPKTLRGCMVTEG